MKWMKYSIETRVEAEDAICDRLHDLGIDALEIEDKRIDPASIEKDGGFYEELMPDLGKDDGSARII
ncbi:MAG: 50S ribosomal protein L11 methyltransferase, partial [Lachnospiraceae bacterium]|nr:50S ribosomal protein L11 methyltransferase [Lachnospiraceae bacterium]